MTDSLSVVIEGNRHSGYQLHLYDGGRWLRRDQTAYVFKWTARRGAKSWLRTERKIRNTEYREVVT